MKSWKAVK